LLEQTYLLKDLHGVHQILKRNCFGRSSCAFMTLNCGKTFSWPALKSLLLVMLKALNFFWISQIQQCHCDVNAITSAKLWYCVA